MFKLRARKIGRQCLRYYPIIYDYTICSNNFMLASYRMTAIAMLKLYRRFHMSKGRSKRFLKPRHE